MLKVTHKSKEQMTELRLAGPMDETAARILSECLPAMGKKVKINFTEVEYFNSLGIRSWVNFLRNLLDGRQVFYEDCPMDFIQQINMIPFLSRGVTILSFFVDFSCGACGFEKKLHFLCAESREKLLERIEIQTCERCQGPLTAEEDPHTLLHFLK